MSHCTNERMDEEIEALMAILMDDVVVLKNEDGSITVETTVFPATASDHSSQYVRVTMVASLLPGYPDISPVITLKNPRGLDDSVLKTIDKEIKKKIDSMLGESLLFELIEIVREQLTESNVPSCHCVICLYGFSESDHFIKTQCYHYFHSHCLVCYLISSERMFVEEQEKLPAWQRTSSFKRLCPVCRESISVDMEALSQAAPPVERESARNFELDESLIHLQQKMAALFKHQQSRGGIIDLEAEESKMLLVTEPTGDENASRPSLPGPSVDQGTPGASPPALETFEAVRDRGEEPPRRGLPRGRGPRGAFAAARKNRGQLYFSSR